MHTIIPSRIMLRAIAIFSTWLIVACAFSGESRYVVQAGNNSDDRVKTRGQDKQVTVRFSFDGAAWRVVLDWLADEADLALHVKNLPTGSFTYTDTRSFTPDEAISRINLFLIPERYTLVRGGKLLSVISLDDERSVRQLDAMAELVEPDKLIDRSRYDLVKCLIPLDELDPDDARQELSGLMLMREPVVMRNTNQLLVTDTAGKLLMVRKIIERMGKPGASAGTVKQFFLGELDADRVLTQIRPHVGLDPLAMIGVDISLSLDSDGKQLLVSGSKENIDSVSSVLERLRSSSEVVEDREISTFLPHSLGDADMQTVIDVLNTLLVDEEDVLMASNVKSNQIMIMARSEIHDLVETTISQLTGQVDNVVFDIIDLKEVDPRYAVSILYEMFEKPALGSSQNQNAVPVDDVPMIEADLINMRLFVRAKQSQIDEMKKIIERLGQPNQVGRGNIRLLPYDGTRGSQILNTAKSFWVDQNELMVFPSPKESQFPVQERAIHTDQPANVVPSSGEKPQTNPVPAKRRNDLNRFSPDERPGGASNPEQSNHVRKLEIESLPPRFVGEISDNENLSEEIQDRNGKTQLKKPAPIRARLTSRGILIQSSDIESLNRFEDHIRMIAGPSRFPANQLAVFFLKYTPAEDANRILAKLLDGTLESSESFGGFSMSGMNFGNRMSNGFLGIHGDGILAAGSATMLSDARLNRLFVIGTAADISTIENHLRVIDKKSSLTQIETHGMPHVIQLRHAKAEDVAAVVRDSYAGRIVKAAERQQQNPRVKNSQSGAQRGPQNPQPQNENQQGKPSQLANSRVVSNRQQSVLPEPKMTLAVDEQGNSLVVTAPEQLYREVEALVLSIDKNAAQTVQIIKLTHPDSPHVRNVLTNIFGDRVKTSSSIKGTSGKTRGNSGR